MEIHIALQEYLNQIGLSQVAIAEKLGVSKAYINALLTGRQRFGKKQAQIWSDEFGISKSWLLTGEGNMLNSGSESFSEEEVEDNGYLVPLVPISVMAGELSSFDPDGVESRSCERVVSPIKGVDLAFPVLGDSMEPEYPNGSKVFVKKINHYDFIAFGNVYVLDTTNGPLLKKVKRSEREDCILCVSLNEAAGYEPFDVPLRTVRAMYRVMMCLSLKG